MNNKYYVGGTGTGKTYRAIAEAKNGSYLIVVPCRQLAYEIAIDYDSISEIKTGEASDTIRDAGTGTVAVYESARNLDLEKYDTVIIDEFHFVTDYERGSVLIDILEKCQHDQKKVIAMTATDSVPARFLKSFQFEKIKLKQNRAYKKKRVNMNQAWDLARNGAQTIYFARKKPDFYKLREVAQELSVDLKYAEFISADLSPLERLEIQLRFQKGEIKLLVSTNIAAQGLNFPAELVIIEQNYYDSIELIEQKIGRVARPHVSDKKTGYYAYCNEYYEDEPFQRNRIRKKKIEKNREEEKKNHVYLNIDVDYLDSVYTREEIENLGLDLSSLRRDPEFSFDISDLDLSAHEVPYFDDENGYFEYGDIKYSKSAIAKILNKIQMAEGEFFSDDPEIIEVSIWQDAYSYLANLEREILKFIKSEIKSRKEDAA